MGCLGSSLGSSGFYDLSRVSLLSLRPASKAEEKVGLPDEGRLLQILVSTIDYQNHDICRFPETILYRVYTRGT